MPPCASQGNIELMPKEEVLDFESASRESGWIELSGTTACSSRTEQETTKAIHPDNTSDNWVGN
jgi:hypothetical protein